MGRAWERDEFEDEEDQQQVVQEAEDRQDIIHEPVEARRAPEVVREKEDVEDEEARGGKAGARSRKTHARTWVDESPRWDSNKARL